MLAIISISLFLNLFSINNATVTNVEKHCETDNIITVDDGENFWEFYGTNYNVDDEVITVSINNQVFFIK